MSFLTGQTKLSVISGCPYYRKCSNKCPGHLFNFLRQGGGANLKVGAYLKGGAYFVFQVLASIIRWWLKSLETESLKMSSYFQGP